MSRVITTAGRTFAEPAPVIDPRREAIRAARAVIRNPESTDDQVDDALEALVELAKE